MDLTVLEQLAVVTVLILDDLMDVSRRRGCTKLALLLLPGRGSSRRELTGFEFRLFALLIALTIVVADLKDLTKTLRWFHHSLLAGI